MICYLNIISLVNSWNYNVQIKELEFDILAFNLIIVYIGSFRHRFYNDSFFFLLN